MSIFDPTKVLAESEKDGWLLGLMGEKWQGPWPKLSGDLYVVAPDGSKANIAWEVFGPPIKLLLGPDESRWGVYQVQFPIQVMCNEDLIRNFYKILPLLKSEYEKIIGTSL